MNGRLITWCLAFSLGLNIVLVGMVLTHLAQGSWPTQPAAATPAASPATHVLQFDEKRLKLSPEQREQFREIRDRWLNNEKKAKSAGVERIAKISEMLVRDNATTRTLQPVFREIREHSDDFFMRLTGALQEYRVTLTPEQRVTFNLMLQERFDSLKRFTRQQSFQFEQRIMQAKQRERKNEKKGNAQNEKKGKPDGKNERKGGKKAERKGKNAAGKPDGQGKKNAPAGMVKPEATPAGAPAEVSSTPAATPATASTASTRDAPKAEGTLIPTAASQPAVK